MMWNTILLILGVIIAVALTIAVCLALGLLLFVGILAGASLLRRVFFPSIVAREQAVARAQRDVPFFVRKRDGHGDMVRSLAVSVDGFVTVSAGRDRTVQVRDAEWNQEAGFDAPFFPGEIALGNQPDLGNLFALGVFREDANLPGDVGIAVYTAAPVCSEPLVRLPLLGVRYLFRVVWTDDRRHLRALAAVYDPSRPLAPNNDPASPNRLVLTEFWVSEVEPSDRHEPRYLPLPPELETEAAWQIGSPDAFALSAGGKYLACRTERETADGTRYGVGVWDVDREQWVRRWGGLEQMPHDLHAVTRGGDRVFSTRQDDPRRDHRNGGAEWYDGLYVWDADCPPEGVEEARPRPDWHGGRGMVLNRDETLIAQPLYNGEARVIDAASGTPLRTLKRPQPEGDPSRYGYNVSCCAFADNAHELVTGHADGQLWWWSLADLRPGESQ